MRRKWKQAIGWVLAAGLILPGISESANGRIKNKKDSLEAQWFECGQM